MSAATAALSSYASSWEERPSVVSSESGEALLGGDQVTIGTFRIEEPGVLVPFTKGKRKQFDITSDKWGSAAGDSGYEARRVTASKLIVTTAETARPLLTDRIKVALDNLIPVVRHVAHQYFVSIKLVEIIGHRASDEDAEEVVVRVWVHLPEVAALTFWDFLGKAIELRTSYLPTEVVDIAADRISFEVISVKNV